MLMNVVIHVRPKETLANPFHGSRCIHVTGQRMVMAKAANFFAQMLGNHDLLLTGDVLHEDTCFVQVEVVEFDKMSDNLPSGFFMRLILTSALWSVNILQFFP